MTSKQDERAGVSALRQMAGRLQKRQTTA